VNLGYAECSKIEMLTWENIENYIIPPLHKCNPVGTLQGRVGGKTAGRLVTLTFTKGEGGRSTFLGFDNALCRKADRLHGSRASPSVGWAAPWDSIVPRPPYSLDLNLIGHVWGWVKSYVQQHYWQGATLQRFCFRSWRL
jgi:hypothetical protein